MSSTTTLQVYQAWYDMAKRGQGLVNRACFSQTVTLSSRRLLALASCSSNLYAIELPIPCSQVDINALQGRIKLHSKPSFGSYGIAGFTPPRFAFCFLPAKSTRWRRLKRMLVLPIASWVLLSTVAVNTQWDLELLSFMFVSPTLRFVMPCRSNWITSSSANKQSHMTALDSVHHKSLFDLMLWNLLQYNVHTTAAFLFQKTLYINSLAYVLSNSQACCSRPEEICYAFIIDLYAKKKFQSNFHLYHLALMHVTDNWSNY